VGKAFRGTGAFKAKKVPLSRIRPPATLKRKSSEHAKASVTPWIIWTPEAVKNWQKVLREYPKRMEEGRKLFLLAAAGVLRDAVKEAGPTVAGDPYAERLRVGLVEGIDNGEGVAVWLEGASSTIKPEDVGTVLIFVRAERGAPRSVLALAKYGPWPVDMLPFRPDKGAQLVSRRVTQSEVQFYREQIVRMKARIEGALHAAGVKVTIGSPGHGVGAHVSEDVAWSILRQEFGLGGERVHPVWRPAIQDMWAALPGLMIKYQKYVMTGNRNVFQLPENDTLSMTEFGADLSFEKALAPFVPKRVPR
jgi:hypothetical protein